MKSLTTILAWLNHSAQPPETQSPLRTATAATFLSLLFVVGLDHYFVDTLPSWWAELLAYAAIPILLAFIVLYRSAWHEGLRRSARALLVAATSCAISAPWPSAPCWPLSWPPSPTPAILTASWPSIIEVMKAGEDFSFGCDLDFDQGFNR